MKLKKKLTGNNAHITREDKGNTAVIIDVNEYNSKTNNFISDNKIIRLSSGPTEQYVKSLNQGINKYVHLFEEGTRRRLKHISSKATMLTGLPKFHKMGIPIRLLINCTTASGYKTAKSQVQIIKHNISLINNHCVVNSIDFINKFKNLNLGPQYKMASLHIVNLYANIPVIDTLQVLRNNLIDTNRLDESCINELMDLLKLVLNQNYVTHGKQFFRQPDGLAMGSPLSGLLTDIYLKHFENSALYTNNKYKVNILFYGRYADDTFLICKGTYRQINELHNYLNSINNNMQFTLETEDNNKLNFLDLTVTRINYGLHFNVYRKPTTTDKVIHADSHCPFSQEMSAFHSLINRLLSLPLSEENIEL